MSTQAETEVVLHQPQTIQHWSVDAEKLKVVKEVIAKGATDVELQFFAEVCKRTGLDPFMKQIYMIKRPGGEDGDKQITIQTAIDGLRIIAERSGKYEGQLGPFWCGPDGQWLEAWLDFEYPPNACRIGILRKDFTQPLWAIAHFHEYVQRKSGGQPTRMWQKMPANQLAKCFTPETEVLTDCGFQRFDSVTGKILQVTDTGLRSTDSRPFSQPYSGPMIAMHGDMLDFCVTPNHDMITTVGKVEARAMFETSFKARPIWHIPLSIEHGRTVGIDMYDADLKLAAAVAADGSYNGNLQFVLGVSRPKKIAALEALQPYSRGVIHSKGAIAIAETRKIKSNFDKARFSFEAFRCSPLMGTDKVFAHSMILALSKRQAKLVLDTWIDFDGHVNKKTGVRRIYTSRPDHVSAIELLAVVAGYAVNNPRGRDSDIATKPNFVLTISEPSPIPVAKPIGDRPGLVMEHFDGNVWCVSVPSGAIIVRREGFSMVCGNCAEALGLRKAFPMELSGIYTTDEMAQSDVSNETEKKNYGPPLPPPPPVQPKPASRPPSDDPEALQEMYGELAKGMGETIAIFGKFKALLSDLTGSDHFYYEILERGEMKHGNDLKGKTRGAVKKVLAELYYAVEKLRAEPELPLSDENGNADDMPMET